MKKAEASPTLERLEIDAIVTGNYQNIFAALGLHSNPLGNGLVIRVFVPWAKTVEVLDSESWRNLGTMIRIHEDGVFELILRRRKNYFHYVLRINNDLILEDPYRFPSSLDEGDIYLFSEGTAEHAYRWMGAHARRVAGVDGVLFAVWAPSAKRVSLVGDFNGWDGRQHVMRHHPASGIWEIFIPRLDEFTCYKFEIIDANGVLLPLKADPYGRSMQHPPETASRVLLNESFEWSDGQWMRTRNHVNDLDRPISVYEVHAGSWKRKPDEANRYLSYEELAGELIPYVLEMGFTHIQFMPISEYPFDGSWGYQPVGMYAPTIRFGTPDEFKYLVNQCHQNNIGVLLDWVPGHFPTDAHGLGKFDGSCLYEHEDPRQGFHPDWSTLIYNYGCCEVISYLLSNANYWLEEFHIDGLRVDAVSSMLYLDYGRKEGEWIPNQYGGRENLEAIRMLQTVNSRVYANHPGVMMVAEESTAWPGVSRPADQDGLGFGFKWNMGWMNDSLRYMEKDPIHRKYHHNEMTFSTVYAWDENFMLSLSHDEVVHGKRSLVEKMPGDDWQKFANLRAYYGFMWAHPGKKLLFMGGEIAQRREWNHDRSLDWNLLDNHQHRGILKLVRDLNFLYRSTPALYERDASPDGFQWLRLHSAEQSIFAWVRRGNRDSDLAIAVVNMTPQTHQHFPVGVPCSGCYRECLNTDAVEYGGSGHGNGGRVSSSNIAWDEQEQSIFITVPALSALIFHLDGQRPNP